MKYHITGFIFDLDGTLVNSGQDLAIAANWMREQFDMPALPIPTIISYVGDGLMKLIERLMPNGNEMLWQQAKKQFCIYYKQHCTDFTQPYPGVIETLQHFDQKVKTVATNKFFSLSCTILERLSMKHHFQAVLGGDSTPKIKPDPLPLLKIMEQFSLHPSQTIMVGDSSNDIIAGQRAGVLTCGVTYGLRPREELDALKPDFMISRFDELIELFD